MLLLYKYCKHIVLLRVCLTGTMSYKYLVRSVRAEPQVLLRLCSGCKPEAGGAEVMTNRTERKERNIKRLVYLQKLVCF